MPSPRRRTALVPFVLAVVMIAASFLGAVFLARSAKAAQAMSSDPACRDTISSDTPAVAGPVCTIVRGEIASVRRIAVGKSGTNAFVTLATFRSPDVTSEIVLDDFTTPADFAKASADRGARAVLETVTGYPAYLAIGSTKHVLAPQWRRMHLAGVVLVAVAISYFSIWIAISIVANRRRAR